MGLEPAGQQVSDTGIAGVIGRPPLLFLAALLLGLASDRLLPWPFAVPGTDPVSWMSAGAMILVGLALATTGIHGWTRNPIYLGMFLVCGGIGIAARSPWTLILMVPLAITIRYGVVAHEERYLETKFGETYRVHRASVRRWL